MKPKFNNVLLRERSKEGRVGKVIVVTNQWWAVEIRPLKSGSISLSWGKGKNRKRYYVDAVGGQ